MCVMHLTLNHAVNKEKCNLRRQYFRISNSNASIKHKMKLWVWHIPRIPASHVSLLYRTLSCSKYSPPQIMYTPPSKHRNLQETLPSILTESATVLSNNSSSSSSSSSSSKSMSKLKLCRYHEIYIRYQPLQLHREPQPIVSSS